mgnify:CR=1 FL=1
MKADKHRPKDGTRETNELTLRPIAICHSPFSSKFGIPRQSGLVSEVHAELVFLPEFRQPDALRGIEQYTHLWLLWGFSEVKKESWSATVRPPRLGGNERLGVFATRSPFRPNPIGLSSVRLLSVEADAARGAVLHIAGADLMDGTPIYDIKPYLPYVDCHAEAMGGFSDEHKADALQVNIPDEWLQRLPQEHHAAVHALLCGDPRPSYHNDEERVYGFPYAGYDIRFTVRDGVATVVEIVPLD